MREISTQTEPGAVENLLELHQLLVGGELEHQPQLRVRHAFSNQKHTILASSSRLRNKAPFRSGPGTEYLPPLPPLRARLPRGEGEEIEPCKHRRSEE